MNILSQRDSRWKNIKLGTSDTTIGGYGCTITCISMILGTTPDVVNERIKTVNGYAEGNLVIWSKLEEAFPGIKIKRVWSYDNTDVLANVPNVLVEVDGKPIGGYRHWVVYIGNKKLIDPWDGLEGPTSEYPDPKSYCVILGKWNKPSPISEDQKIIDQLRTERDHNWDLYGASQQELESVKKLNAELNADYEGVKQELNSYKGILQTFATLLGTKVSETEKMSGEIKRLIEKEDMYTSVSKMNENLMNEVGTLQSEVSTKNTTISQLNMDIKDKQTVLDICLSNKETKELKEYSWFTRLRSLFS